MTLRPTLLACALVLTTACATAQEPPKPLGTQEILDASPAEDWRTLDPRQYDPRRIIREALLDDAPVPTVRAAGAAAAVTTASAFTKPRSASMPFTADDPPPFDSEAT